MEVVVGVEQDHLAPPRDPDPDRNHEPKPEAEWSKITAIPVEAGAATG